MNAIELYHKDGKATGVFYCVKCRCVSRDKVSADKCCEPMKCDMCGCDVPQYHSRCSTCWQLATDQKERERFEKAEKVTEWSGPVFCEGVGYNEGFAGCIEDLLDDVEPEDMPEYVWTCLSRPSCELDYDSIIENATSDAHEEFDPGILDGAEELKAAIEKFNEQNKGYVSWEPDFTKALLIQKPTQ